MFLVIWTPRKTVVIGPTQLTGDSKARSERLESLLQSCTCNAAVREFYWLYRGIGDSL